MIRPVRCSIFRIPFSFLPAALALAVLQGLSGYESQSQNTPHANSSMQSASIRLDPVTRKQVLTEAAVTIRDQYADREVGNALASKILAFLEEDYFNSVVDADSLVVKVMAVIRTMVPDRHFDFYVAGKSENPTTAPQGGALSKHGLRTIRLLEYDTGYLEFDGLPGDNASMNFVEQSLTELPVVRALILDIRRNIGGSGDMVALLCSHLLEEGTLLYKYYDRSGNPPGEMKANSYPRHFGLDIPVFVLTSRSTLSAAEALAYILQDYGRAKIVGQYTSGMANPSRTFLIGENFKLTVPFLLLRYGKSAGTFAGCGITPDMVESADSALDIALEEIRERFGPSEH